MIPQRVYLAPAQKPPSMDPPGHGNGRGNTARKPSGTSEGPGPNPVISGKGPEVVVEGLPFSTEIHHLQTDRTWTLEIVDHEGTSHVWNDHFQSGREAQATALEVLEREGAIAFIRSGNVLPFRRS